MTQQNSFIPNQDDLSLTISRLSKTLSFDLLAQIFVSIIAEKYPTPDKLLSVASALKIQHDPEIQNIIYLELLKGLRQVSPRLFQSPKHYQDLILCYTEVLKNIEKELEEKGISTQETKV